MTAWVDGGVGREAGAGCVVVSGWGVVWDRVGKGVGAGLVDGDG